MTVASQVDRIPQPCHHKRANHQHGTPACYVLDRCRCVPCSTAASAAEQWRNRQQAYGRYDKYLPAGPVRDHIQTLRDAGMGLNTIARASGVATGTLSKLVYGVYAPGPGGCRGKGDLIRPPSKRVLRTTAEKLYAIDPPRTGMVPLADKCIADVSLSTLASRRLQSLVALGWSMSELGRRLGFTHSCNALPAVKGDRRLRAGTIRRANALFAELCMTLPPSSTATERARADRARAYARAAGWPPPLALNDTSDIEVAS